MESLIRWSNRMPKDAITQIEQHYLHPLLTQLAGEYLLLIGEHKPLSWLPEHSLHAIQLANCVPPTPRTSWVQGHFDTLPFRDNQINAIIVPYILEYCTHPEQLIKELFRVLVPEGKLWLLGFHRWHPWCWLNAPRPYQSLPPWKIISLAKENGFFISHHRYLYYGALYGMEMSKSLSNVTPLPITWPQPLWNKGWQPTIRKALSRKFYSLRKSFYD